MKLFTLMVTLLTSSVAAACGSSQLAAAPVAGTSGSGVTKGGVMQRLDLDSAVRLARADAARLTGAPADSLTLISAERVTWSNGSIGCPMPGIEYTQALVPGFRVRLRGPAGELDYHSAERGGVLLCPAKRATDPVSGGYNSKI
ncbi:MAG: hypothetical protein ABI564_02235 [Ideonella sp.]